MSSLKFIFILCLFLTTFNVSGRNGTRGLTTSQDASDTRVISDDPCELEYESLINTYGDELASECQCRADTTSQEIKNCFEIADCKRNCEKSISESGFVNRCDNIVKNVPYFCEEKCNRNVAFNIQSIQNTQEFKKCKDDQKKYLQQACGTHIESIGGQKGAKLVCEHEGGCGTFCKLKANDIVDKQCGNIITNGEGFGTCNKAIYNQLDEELNTSPLPPDLSWQKCAYGMSCASEIKMAFSQAEQECNNLKSKATICCEEPLKCAEAGTSDLFKSSGTVAGGITQNCREIQERLSNIGNVTQQMADKCKSIASSCVQVCTQQINDNFLAVFDKHCTFDLTTEQAYDRNKHTCEENLISYYVEEYQNKLASVPGQCELVGRKSEGLKQQSAEEMLRSSASGQKCAEQASVGSSESEPSPEAPTQMAVLGSDTSDVKTSPTPDNSLRWNPGKAKKGTETIVSGASAGGSSKKASRRASTNQARRANIGARQAPAKPAQKKKGFLSRLLSAFGGSKKNAEKQKEGTTVGSGPQAAASGSNNANVGGGGRDVAQAKESLAGKEKVKADKKSKEHSIRKFSKAGSGKDSAKKIGSVLDRGITPRDITSAKLGKYGSPHDNIFERLSHRIITLCRQDRIDDCQL